MPRRQHGFTMVELIIVLIITGILAAVAVPRLLDTDGFAARGARDHTASALRYAQKSAVAMRRNVCVALTTTGMAITYASAAGNSQACVAGNALANPANGLPYSDTSNALPGGATLTVAASVSFDAQGRPMSTPGTALSTAMSISVTGNANPITIEPETGAVR